MTVPIIPGGRDRRDVTIDVTITSDTRGSTAAAKGLGDVDKAADKAGDSLQGMAVDAKALQAEVERTTRRIADLDAQLVAVGNDKGTRRSLRAEESWLRELQKIAKRMEADSGGGIGVTLGKSIGSSAGPSMLGSITDSLGQLPAKLKGTGLAVGAGLGVLMAPAIGGAVAGAVVGGVGLGGIAGGVAAASRDPRVQEAAKEFGSSISTMFFSSGDAMVEPIINSLGILQDAYIDLDLESVFEKGAPALERLADGAGRFAKNIMPGVNAIMDDAVPIATELGDGFAYVGDGLGDFLKEVVQSEGDLEGLRTLFILTGDTARGFGKIIGGLSNAYHELGVAYAAYTGALEDIPGIGGLWEGVNNKIEQVFGSTSNLKIQFHAMGDAAETATPQVAGIGAAAHITAEDFGTLLQRTEDYYNFVTSQRDNAISFEEGLDRLAESVRENGRSLDITNASGRINVGILADMEAAAKRTRDENIKNGQAVETANIIYDQQIERIKVQAKNLRLSKTQVDALLGSWRNLASMSNIELRAHFEMSGTMLGEHSGPRSMERRASGGPVLGGRSYIVGDGGVPEVLTMPAGTSGYVHRSVGAYAAAMGGGMGSAPQAARPLVVSGDGLAQMFMRWLRNEIQSQGGTLAVLGIRS